MRCLPLGHDVGPLKNWIHLVNHLVCVLLRNNSNCIGQVMLVHSYGVYLVKMPLTVSLFLVSSKTRNQPLGKGKPGMIASTTIKRSESVENEMEKPVEHYKVLKVNF